MKKIKQIQTFAVVVDTTKEEADRLTNLGLNKAKELTKELEKIEIEFRKLPAHARINFYANLIDILWTICGLPPYLKISVLNNSIAFHTHAELGNMIAQALPETKDSRNYIG